MNIVFLGVGEACDENYPNASILVNAADDNRQTQVLLDCGFTTPHIYFAACNNADELDALWISHFHGDHFFGTPLLLLRFWEMGRRKPLLIIGQPGVEERISAAMDLAYATLRSKFNFPLRFVELEPGRSVAEAGINWQAAANDHSAPSLSVRLEKNGKKIFYSGDGRPTASTVELARGCDLVVHEAFRVNGETPGHGSISGCLDFALAAGVKNLALIHLQRHERLHQRRQIEELIKKVAGPKVFIPEPGDIFTI